MEPFDWHEEALTKQQLIERALFRMEENRRTIESLTAQLAEKEKMLGRARDALKQIAGDELEGEMRLIAEQALAELGEGKT